MLHHPDSLKVLANLQSMANGNSLYHTDLPGSSRINIYFPQQTSKLEATCTFLKLISEVPSHQRELEGAGERTMETLPSSVRKCVDNVAVSIRYDVMVVWM